MIESLHAVRAKRVSIITPYTKTLTKLVTSYIENESIEVIDAISLEVPDNLAVGRLDPLNLLDVAKRLNTSNADAIVLSACVQMPSLPALGLVQKSFGVPVMSSAAATVYRILQVLNIRARVPDAGDLLSGKYN